MRITAIETVPYALPSRRPLSFANGAVKTAEHVLVRVHTDAGLTGIAEASPRSMTYGESPHSVVASVRDWFAPQLIGLDPRHRERGRVKYAHVIGNNTARAAIDIALWDVVAKAEGVSLFDRLGGYSEEVDVSHMLGMGAPSEVAAEAEEMRKRHGIRAFKVKVGLAAARDVEVFHAVRSAVGPDALLYVDANHGWTASEALRAVNAMAPGDLAWVEEPSPAADRVGRRWLAERLEVPIAGDESCITVRAAAHELAEGNCQIIALKTARTGITDSQRMLGLVEGMGAQIVVGSQLEGALGVAANLVFAAAHCATAATPAELTHHLRLQNDILVDMPEIKDGKLRVPNGPGLGVAIDEQKLARCRTDRER